MATPAAFGQSGTFTTTETAGTYQMNEDVPPKDVTASELVKEEHQLGTFTIPHSWLDRYPEALRDFMKDCIVVDVDRPYPGKFLRYTAISTSFDTIKIGDVPTTYDVTLVRDGEQPVIMFANKVAFIRGMGEQPQREESIGLSDKELKKFLKKAKKMVCNKKPLEEMDRTELLALAAKGRLEADETEKRFQQLQAEQQQPWTTSGATSTGTSYFRPTRSAGASGGVLLRQDTPITVDTMVTSMKEQMNALRQEEIDKRAKKRERAAVKAIAEPWYRKFAPR